MLFKGLLATSLSGSVDGIVASHNRGGAYFRNRAIPTQPNTAEQLAVKGFFGDLAAVWRDTLTQAQRDDWDLYATATPLINSIGEEFTPTGLNMFIRGNVPLLQAGESRVDAGPITAGLPELTPPGAASVESSTDVASVTFDNTDPWANDDAGFLLVYASRGQSASINFFKGPYQFAGMVDGNSTTPPTSPQNVTVPFNVADGHRVFFRYTAIDGEGRKSQNQFSSTIVTTG